MRNEKVTLPMEAVKSVFIRSPGTRASTPMTIRLGQSIATVSQRMRAPKNTPSTRMPASVMPSGGERRGNRKIQAKERIMYNIRL